jgi:hypothetical protein
MKDHIASSCSIAATILITPPWPQGRLAEGLALFGKELDGLMR